MSQPTPHPIKVSAWMPDLSRGVVWPRGFSELDMRSAYGRIIGAYGNLDYRHSVVAREYSGDFADAVVTMEADIRNDRDVSGRDYAQLAAIIGPLDCPTPHAVEEFFAGLAANRIFVVLVPIGPYDKMWFGKLTTTQPGHQNVSLLVPPDDLVDLTKLYSDDLFGWIHYVRSL